MLIFLNILMLQHTDTYYIFITVGNTFVFYFYKINATSDQTTSIY